MHWYFAEGEINVRSYWRDGTLFSKVFNYAYPLCLNMTRI